MGPSLTWFAVNQDPSIRLHWDEKPYGRLKLHETQTEGQPTKPLAKMKNCPRPEGTAALATTGGVRAGLGLGQKRGFAGTLSKRHASGDIVPGLPPGPEDVGLRRWPLGSPETVQGFLVLNVQLFPLV